MTMDYSEQREQEFSERFTEGARDGRDAEEAQAFRAYRTIGDELRSHETPDIDAAALSQRMAREAGSPRGTLRDWRDIWNRRAAPVLAAACGAVLLIGITKLLPLLRTPDVSPLVSAKFANAPAANYQSAPFVWTHRIQRGGLVTVPRGTNAKLVLYDGSIVSCSPETQIAVRPDGDRHITLNSGAITVTATHIEGSTMTVATPLGSVEVVGTTFWIEVIR